MLVRAGANPDDREELDYAINCIYAAMAELEPVRCTTNCIHFGSEDSCCIIGSICDGEYEPDPSKEAGK
jgi:hypothetical protein